MSGLTDFQTIPIVNVSGLYGSPAEQAAVAAELAAAASQVGFLYVTGHGVPEELFEGVLGEAQRFFAQPLEQKMEVYIGNSSNHRGYVPTGDCFPTALISRRTSRRPSTSAWSCPPTTRSTWPGTQCWVRTSGPKMRTACPG
jgi:hypothetical protein